MPSNRAAWLDEAKAYPLIVRDAPYTAPAANEVVIKNHAIALNPVDNLMQNPAPFPNNYPAIIGQDIAGTIVEVGSAAASLFKPGDRVLAHATSMLTHKPANGAFQEHVTLQHDMVAKIPDSLSFEDAAVIPLGASTASCGMYQKDYLGLQHPSSTSNKPTGEAFLIWGGATSPGSNAIQLAKASGYEVLTTCSPRSFDAVRKLGADHIFDYRSPSVVTDILAALKGKTLAGALQVGEGPDALKGTIEVVQKSEGKKFIASVIPLPKELPPHDGVQMKFIFGLTLKDNEVGGVLYNRFLTEALAQGKYVATPPARVVGKGLESVQKALDMRKNEPIPGEKIVVTL